MADTALEKLTRCAKVCGYSQIFAFNLSTPFGIVPTSLECAFLEVGWGTSFEQQRNLNQDIPSVDALYSLIQVLRKERDKDIKKDIANVCQLLLSTGNHTANSEAMGNEVQGILHSVNKVAMY